MNSRLRAAAVLVLLTGVVALWYALRAGDSDVAKIGDPSLHPSVEGKGPLTLNDSKDCRECHPRVYEEWKGSHHEFAWRNPEPRRKDLSDNFKNKDCIPCHAPRPLIEVGWGARALERQTRRDDGVNCFTCHRYKNVVAAPHELSPAAADAPCNPVTWAPIRTMTLCAPCHDQHKVNRDWLQTRFATDGPDRKDCNDCHMPVLPGAGTEGSDRTEHRGHGFPGGHDPEFLKSSATLRARFVSPDEDWARVVADLTGRDDLPRFDRGSAFEGKTLLLIEVKNTGVGHNLPADERHRAVDLEILLEDRGSIVMPELRLARFRNPYRSEFDAVNPFADHSLEVIPLEVRNEDVTLLTHQVRLPPEFRPDRKIYYPKSTQLMAGESRLVWTALPRSGERLRLRLYYKLNPFLANDRAVVTNERWLDVSR